jgi:hypothetical protein
MGGRRLGRNLAGPATGTSSADWDGTAGWDSKIVTARPAGPIIASMDSSTVVARRRRLGFSRLSEGSMSEFAPNEGFWIADQHDSNRE